MQRDEQVAPGSIAVEPVTPDRWADLERLFGPSGAYAGCWCMYPRLTGREFDAEHGEGTRSRLQALVDAGEEPGLLAMLDGEPVGWVSVGPRPVYGRILRSPLFRPDRRGEDPADPAVWSVVCFFVGRAHRGGGLADPLLAGAVEHAAARGARVVEGYPAVPGPGVTAEALYWGTPAMFARAGFVEAAAPSPGRRLVRRDLT